MATTFALSDQQRGIIELVARLFAVGNAFIILNAFMGNTQIPIEVIWIFALINALLIVFKEFVGVRNSTTARVAKETNSSIDQFRKIPDQK